MNHYTRFFNILVVLLSLFSFDCLAQNNDIVITQQPTYESVCAGEGTNLSVEVNGAGLTYQWQVRSPYGFENIIDNSDYSGAQTAELGISSITKSMNLWEYRCKISSGTTKIYSRSTFLVLKNALLSYSPKDATGYKGDAHLFYVQATGDGLVYQWQVNTGEGFSNIDNGANYEGTDRSVMNIKEVLKKMEGYQFRCLISGEACEPITIVSDGAILTLSTAANLLKSISSGTPDNVVWYMDGGSEDDNAVRFMGNPLVYVDGAIKMVNNGQISSESGNGSCDVLLTGNIYNENAATNLFSAGDDTVFEFIGADEQKIYGENANNPDEALDHTNFYRMVVNKSTSDDKLQLHDDISVRLGVYFQTGDLELNAQELELTYLQLNDAPYSLSTGNNSFPIITETEYNRVTGVDGGEIVIKDLMILNNPMTSGLNLGNIGAEIIQNSGTDFLAETTLNLKRGHTTNSNGTTSINRYYDINLTETSTGNPVGNVPVDAAVDFKFHYLDGDNSSTEANLNLYKSEDGMTVWENQEANDPDVGSNFVVKENLEDLTGEWTLFPCENEPVVTIIDENNNLVTEVRLCHGAITTINTSIVYTGIDAITYQWILDGTVTVETGDTYSMTGVSGENDQTLVVAASNSTGCLSKYQVTIVHEDELVLDILNDTEVLCGGSSIDLPNLGVNTLGNYSNGAEWKVRNNTDPANILATVSGTTYTFDADIAPFSTPGNYTVEVTANTAYCSVTDSVVITVNAAVTADLGSDISICAPINSTILNPNASGGSGSYTYSWTPNNPTNGAATYQVENINTTTTYSVLITDTNDANCTITGDIILNYSNIEITPSAGTITDVDCHGANTGAINFMISGATSSIVITDGNDNAFDMIVNNAGDITISELLAGDYTVKITDGNGCVFEESFTVDEPTQLTLDGNLSDMITNILCNGGTTGAIDLAITGGSLPYTYSWSGSNVMVSSQDQTGLSAGTYTVVVTDGNDCEFTEDFIINEPTNPLALNGFASDMITHVNCFGEETGAINLAVMGGTISGGSVSSTDGYQIEWSGPESGTASISNDPGSFLIDNLNIGSYTVTITDDNNCTINQGFEITEPAAALTVSSVTTPSCSDSDSGTISLTTTGGSSPYSYSWSPATVNGSSPTSLAGGFYSVTITDNNGCDFILTNLEILILPALNPNAIVTDVSCNGFTNGAINLTPSGGSGIGYEFAWDNGVFTSTQEDIGTLSPADYNLTITDDNGCTAQALYTVASPDALLLNEVVNQISCNAENDGSITLNVTGGSVNDPTDYVYQWAGNLGTNSSTGSSLTDLTEGTYLVTVTDDNMCETTGNFMIIEPNAITASPVQTNISCFFTENYYDDGEITLYAEGGTNLNYSWSGPPPNEYQPADNIFSLSAGTYNVTITDENGCPGPGLEFIITKPLAINVNIVVNQLDCFEDTDGQISLNPTGGTSPYSVEWEYPDGNSITTPSNIYFINNLSQTGIYTYLITDANGCNYPDINFQEPPYFNEIELTSPSEILIAEVVTDLTVNGQNNGAIDITVSGGTPLPGADPYTFLWSNGATTEDLTGVSGGIYMVDITDTNGCIQADTFDVYEPNELLLQVEIQQNPECIGSDNGVLLVSIDGGVGPYIISWSFGVDYNTIFYNLAPGDYILNVTDANGATVMGTYTLVNPVQIDDGEVITPLICNGDNDASITLTPSWAADPANNSFEYQWEDFPMNTTNTIDNLASGDYTVTITYTVFGNEADTYCEFIETYTIAEPDPILTTPPTVSPATCAGANDGSIDLVPTGGASPFTYNWTNTSTSDNGTGAQITGLLADTYQITITDADNCTATTTAIVEEPATVNVFISGNALICDNESTVFDASSGSGFSSYLWSPNGQITPTITVSDAGIYSVAVTDADGCTATANRELFVSPTSTISNIVTTCDVDNMFYSIDFASDGFNISSDFGTVVDNMNGTYTISNIPSGQGLNITSQSSSDPPCSVTESVTADCSCNTAPDAPVISMNELTICEDETIPTFTATVGTDETVDWYDVSTNGTPILEDNLSYTPTAAGIYYAEARSTIDDCTSTTRTSITLTINSLPTANAGTIATICTGESTTLDASGSSGNTDLNYSWTPIDDLNDATVAMPIATPTTGTLYTLVVTDQNGCSETADVMVNVNSLPTLVVNSSSCSADLLTYSIEITTDGNTVSILPSDGMETVTDNADGTFTISGIQSGTDVTVTSENTTTTCENSAAVTAPDCNCPTIAAPTNDGDRTICVDEAIPTLTVTVDAGETANWYDMEIGGNLLESSSTSYTPTAAGTFYVQAINTTTNCTSGNLTELTLTISDLPIVDAGMNTTICIGESTTLDASGSTGTGTLTYSWSPSTGLNATNIPNPVATPTTSTTYTVEVTDGNGCSSTGEVEIDVNPLPTLTGITATCAADLLTYTIEVTTDGNTVSILPSDGMETITDNADGTFTISGIPSGTDVTVTSENTTTTCENSAAVIAPDCNCPTIAAPTNDGDMTICEGTTIPTLTVSVEMGETADWYDAASGGTLLVEANTSFTPTTEGTYYAQARNTTTECTSTNLTPVTLTINPLPVVDAGMGIAICIGESTTLDASGSTGSGILTYSWTPTTGLDDANIVNPVASPSTSTSYTVEVTDGNMCSSIGTVVVTVNDLPVANSGIDATICIGESTTLDASGSTGTGTLTYSWSPTTGLSATNIANPIANPTATITYTVEVTDENGCTSIAQTEVIVNDLPILTIGAIACSADLLTYTVEVTTDGDQVTHNLTNPDITITDNGGGSFTIEGIPAAEDIVITSTNSLTNCQQSLSSNHPDCSCDFVEAPVSNGNASYCFGTTPLPTLSVSVNAGETVDWYASATGTTLLLANNLEYTPTEAGTYFAETRNEITNCISSTRAQVTLIANDLPTAEAGDDVSICLNEEVILNASSSTGFGSLTYEWSPETGLSATDIPNPIANPTATTTYTVEVTDENGCINTDNIEIIVNPLPVVTTDAELSICAGQSTNLNAVGSEGTGVFTYSWSPTTGLSATNIANPLASPTFTIIYTVEVTDENGCMSTAQTEVIVNNLPVLTISSIACSADLLTYTVEVTTDGDQVTHNLTNPDITITDNGGGSFTIEGIPAAEDIVITSTNSLTNCQQSLSSNHPDCSCDFVEAPVSNGNASYCFGTTPLPTLSVSVNAEQTVDWYASATGTTLLLANNLEYTPTEAGTYFAETRNEITNCISSTRAQVTLIANDLPTVEAGDDVSICLNEEVILNASSSTGFGSLTYEWSPETGLSATDIPNPIANPTATTTYTVEVTDENGCINTDMIEIIVNPLPVVTTDAELSICAGQSTNLNAVGSEGTGVFTYSWSPTTGLSATNIANPLASPTFTIIYTVEVTDENGCMSTAQTEVIVNDLPILTIDTDLSICAGESANLNAIGSGGTGVLTYSWSPATALSATDIANPIASPIETTIYTVEVTDENGCMSFETVTLTIFSPPFVDAGENEIICVGESVTLSVTGSGEIYFWSPATGLSATNIQNPIANPTETTIYTVEITDENGCISSGEVEVLVNELPLLNILSSNCTPDFDNYDVEVEVNDGNEIFASLGTTIDNGGGFFSITNIPIEENVFITVVNSTTTGCESIPLEIEAPDCDCPTVENPISNGNITICEDELITPLSVAVNTGETADWYNAAIGGDLIFAGNTSYLPTEAGTFYAEARNELNDCTSNSRVAVSLIINALPLISFADPTDICGNESAIALTATPANGTFSGEGVNGNSFDPNLVSPGFYTLTYTFTNDDGCTNSAMQDIQVFDVPIATASSNSPACVGGSLTLTEVGGEAIDWVWTSPNGSIFNEQSPIIESLTSADVGIYELVITNVNDCTNTTTIMTELVPEIMVNITPDNPTFCPGSSVEITAIASGANSDYNYTWESPSGIITMNALVDATEEGAYIWTVMDDLGCSKTGTQQVIENPSMTINFTAIEASCNESNGSLSAEIIGGTPPFSFEWEGLTNITSDLTDIESGSYLLTVTDGLGCVFSDIGIVNDLGDLIITQDEIVNVLCAGEATGRIDLIISGGLPPYTYIWSNGATTASIENLESGDYVIEVTDANGCSVTSLIPILDPLPLESTTEVTPTSSSIIFDGAIDLTVTGGTGGYQYLWNTGSSNEDLSNLFIGTYSVTITDGNNCELIDNATVFTVIPLSVDLVTQNISCSGLSNGSIEVVTTGNLVPFTYLWNTGSTMESLTDLSLGTYTVTVTDQSGDTVVETTNVTATSDMQAIEQITDVPCNGNNNGAATVFVSGGEPDYVFNWSTGDTGPTISGQSAGDYVVTITDDLECTLVFPLTIDEPSALTVTTESITPVDCFGNTTGAIDISISGGVGPYTQVWSQGALSEDVTNLAAGDYNVLVIDFQQCATNIPFTITQSDLLTIGIAETDVLCFGDATGSLIATVSGGIPASDGYTYLWSTGEDTPSIDNLLAGNYFLTVTDDLGCTQVGNDFVNQPLLLNNVLTLENASCFDFNDGSAFADISGGTAPYNFVWTNGSTDALAENLEAGIYTLLVTDDVNCEFTEEVEIMQPDTLIQSYTVTDLNCFGDFGGAINLDISGGTTGTGDYTISWSNGQFVEEINQLSSGEYTVIITDDNNCINYDTITVNQPDVLSVVEEVQDALCFNDENGTITLNVSGGTLPYDFDWSTGVVTTDAITSQIENLSEGNYTSLITDENGCEIAQEIEIMQPDLLGVDFQIQRAGCRTDEDGSIDLTAFGGTPSYTYLWSNAETSQSISDITAGDYVVTVSDLNDCTIEKSFSVAETDTTFTAYFLAASGLFDVDSVEVLADELIQFIDVSYPQPLTWEWSFNNPSNSTSGLPNPSFSYLIDEDDTIDETAYFPQLIVTNLFCRDSIEKTIWITNNFRITAPETDSLIYLGFNYVNAYPNPSSGLVTVDVELTYEHGLQLSVVDILGNIHQRKTLEGDDKYSINIDMSGFMPGVYFINLYSLDQIYTVRVVIIED